MARTEYERVIEKATSVKTIKIIREPTPRAAGIADFTYRPVFSVFDIGTIIPPVPLDNTTVCLMVGFNFELLEEEGVESTHYFGVLDSDEKLISAREAMQKGHKPDTMRVQFVHRIQPEFREGQWDYSKFKNPTETSYVLPLEFISRNELPKESSIWKRIERGELTLADLGLPEGFKKGDVLPHGKRPLLDYSTKFEPDDRYISARQAREILNMDDGTFEKLNETTRKASWTMTRYALSRGFKRIDGKVEYVTMPSNHGQTIVLGDVVCTWHEDRLLYKGFPVSKQLIRDEMRKLNPAWYDEIQRAKAYAKSRRVDDFRTLMNPEITYTLPSEDFFYGINKLFQAATNVWVDKKVYDPFPERNESIENNLEHAIEGFTKRV